MTDPKNTPFTHDPTQRVEAAAIKGGVLSVNLGTLDHPQTVAIIIRPDKMREVLGVLGMVVYQSCAYFAAAYTTATH